MRLVVLGGSGTSTPELFDALAEWPAGISRRPALEVVLVGRTPEKLAAVEAACRARIGPGPPLRVWSQMDRRRAIEGSDVILNQVRIGGYAARAFDESFPWACGLPGEETMGPGGFANASRTVPALRSTWSDVAELAPEALVINLTNPAGIVQAAALAEFPQLRVVSVCDSPLTLLNGVTKRLGRDSQRVWSRYLGMNHLGWYVPEALDGADTLEAIADLAVGNDPMDVRLQQAVPSSYVRYYLHPGRILAQQRGRPPRAQTLKQLESRLLAGFRTEPGGEHPRRGAISWYLAVLCLLDASFNRPTDATVIAGVLNAGRLPLLPPDIVLEVPHHVDGHGALCPAELVALPPLPWALLQAHAVYESLVVRALLVDSEPEAMFRALLANPMVHDVDQAAALWELLQTDPANVAGPSTPLSVRTTS